MKPRQVVAILGEFIVIALVYSALSLTLRLVPAGPKTALDLARLILGNLVVVAAVGFYVANAREVGWVVTVTAAVTLGVTQILIPRLELALPAGGDIRRVVNVGMNGVLAGMAVAVGLALVFDLLDLRPRRPRFPGLLRNPESYLWRLPPLVVLHGVLQFGAMEAARSFLRTSRAGPTPLDLLVSHLICAAVWVSILALTSLGLRVPFTPTVLMMAAIVVVPGLVGRYFLIHKAPPAQLATFLILTALADTLVIVAAAFLLVRRTPVRRSRMATPRPPESDAAEQPAVEQPEAEQAAVEQPEAEQPAMEQLEAAQPAAEQRQRSNRQRRNRKRSYGSGATAAEQSEADPAVRSGDD